MKTIVHALIAVALFLTTATSSVGDTGLVQPVLTSFDFNIVGVGLRVAPEY